MRNIAVVLIVALIWSIAYVPPAQAAQTKEDEPNLITSVVVLAGIALGLKYLADKGAEKQAAEAERARQERLARIQEYADANPDVSPHIIDAMSSRGVAMGMNAEQLRLSLGEPTRINRSVGSWGVHEQWVYRVSSSKSVYIYLENGLVTSWQN